MQCFMFCFKLMTNYTKKLFIVSPILIIVGVFFCWLGINFARNEKDSGAFLFLLGGALGSIGLCCLKDAGDSIGEPEPEPQKPFDAWESEEALELNKRIQEQLSQNETIIKKILFINLRGATFVDGKFLSLAVATNKRILKLKTNLTGFETKSILYEKISCVDRTEGLVFDKLEFSTSGANFEIENIIKGKTQEFVDFVNSKL